MSGQKKKACDWKDSFENDVISMGRRDPSRIKWIEMKRPKFLVNEISKLSMCCIKPFEKDMKSLREIENRITIQKEQKINVNSIIKINNNIQSLKI